MSRKRSAFTLIELLVVIAIIALLVSILLPSLKQAKEQAKQVICMTNLKSIFSGLGLYAEDWEGVVPQTGHTFLNDDGEECVVPWNQMLTVYGRDDLEGHPDWPTRNTGDWGEGDLWWRATRSCIGDPETYKCPSTDPAEAVVKYPADIPGGGGYWDYDPWYCNGHAEYGLNNRRHGHSSAWPKLWGGRATGSTASDAAVVHHKLGEPAQPEKCYLAADSWWLAFDHTSHNDTWLSERHGSKIDSLNVMYCDGSVVLTPEIMVITMEEQLLSSDPNYTGDWDEGGTPWWGGTTK